MIPRIRLVLGNMIVLQQNPHSAKAGEVQCPLSIPYTEGLANSVTMWNTAQTFCEKWTELLETNTDSKFSFSFSFLELRSGATSTSNH